jgi:transposase
MPKPCSLELHERVVDAVESGVSRREAADWFEVSHQFGNQMDAAPAGDRKHRSQAERGQQRTRRFCLQPLSASRRSGALVNRTQTTGDLDGRCRVARLPTRVPAVFGSTSF